MASFPIHAKVNTHDLSIQFRVVVYYHQMELSLLSMDYKSHKLVENYHPLSAIYIGNNFHRWEKEHIIDPGDSDIWVSFYSDASGLVQGGVAGISSIILDFPDDFKSKKLLQRNEFTATTVCQVSVQWY